MASTALTAQPAQRVAGGLAAPLGQSGAIEVHDSRLGDSALAGPAIHEDAGKWLSTFDGIYREANGDVSRIPWAHRKPCPSLIAWLNAEGSRCIRPGSRVVVVGCGLGEDAAALAERGYDVTAFDACPAAVESARRLRPEMARCFIEADLFNLPARLVHRYELVVEVHTLQSLPPQHRHALAEGMSRLLAPRGVLLAIARARDDSIPVEGLEGPPFPLTACELRDVMASCGLSPMSAVDDFVDDNSPPVRRLRGVFHKPLSR